MRAPYETAGPTPLSQGPVNVKGMEKQLALIPTGNADWRIDRKTREVARAGLAQAREALEAAVRRAGAAA